MDINEIQDPDYDVVTISNLGFVDPYGNEGLVILQSDDKREFHMRAPCINTMALPLLVWTNPCDKETRLLLPRVCCFVSGRNRLFTAVTR